MAIAEIHYATRSGPVAGAFGKTESRRRPPKSEQSRFLRPKEIEEIQAHLVGIPDILFGGSAHGSLEHQLLRSGPRDGARRHVLDELERASGRAPEGRIIRIVALDWDPKAHSRRGITVYEVKRAVEALVQRGRIERIPVPPPVMPTTDNEDAKITNAQREWTGFDLRLVRKERGKVGMRLALRAVPKTQDERDRERWRAQDEALRQEWQTMHIAPSKGGVRDYDPDPSQNSASGRVGRALERISTTSAMVLRAMYGVGGVTSGMYGELTPLVSMTTVVQRDRECRAEALARKRGGGPDAMSDALREIRPLHVLIAHAKDGLFVGAVRDEAEVMLVRACKEYRAARRGK